MNYLPTVLFFYNKRRNDKIGDSQVKLCSLGNPSILGVIERAFWSLRMMELAVRGKWGLLLVAALSIVLFTFPQPAFAATGTIAGSVTYFDGTAISGATVTATNTGDGTTKTATTDSSGAFSITGVAVGTHRVSVSYSTRSSDLDSTSVSGVTVTSGDTTTISTAILIGSNGWVACDSVILTNCVQSMTVNGSTTSAARAEPFSPSSDVLAVPVYGALAGSTYSGSDPYRDLSAFGFSTSDTFVIKVLLNSLAPVATMAMGGDIQSWSYDSSTKVATYTVKPVAISRGATCDASSCQNQADGDISAYLFVGSSDMSTSTAPAAWITALDGGHISTDGQYVAYPTPNNDIYGFSAGAPHLKADGSLNTGFIKVFLPDAMLDYMWNKDSTSAINFTSRTVSSDGTTSQSKILSSSVSGGLLIEQTGMHYSVNDMELSPARTPTPAMSWVGLTILATLFAALITGAVMWRSRPAISRN